MNIRYPIYEGVYRILTNQPMLIINLLIYILFYRLDKSSHFLSSREDNFSFPLGGKTFHDSAGLFLLG